MKDQEGNIRQWEAGRMRLIEEQSLKKENEHTHRAALYVLHDGPGVQFPKLTITDLCQVSWKTVLYFEYDTVRPDLHN
jgi:hypothetical protein